MTGRFSHAQIGGGALTGTVSDQTGQAVPGAVVTATSLATNQSRSSVTSEDGGYVFQGLAPGAYRLHVELTGFRPLTREGVGLATGETVRVDLQMQLGGLSESVTVSGDASLLRSQTSGLGQVVDNKKVVALPLNGRSFISLAGLAPGVALPPGLVAAAHQRRPAAHERVSLRRHLGAAARAGTGGVLPEHRRHPGVQDREQQSAGRIRPVQRRRRQPDDEGGQQRVSRHRLRVPPQRGAERAQFLRDRSRRSREFRRNQFGGVAGGPIREDRTFFFVDYQGQRQTIGRPVISTVPTMLQRQGIFTEAIGARVPVDLRPGDARDPVRRRTQFPGNAIPPDRIDPVACELLRAIRYQPAPAPRTTIGASTTRRSIRTSSTSGSIISFRQTAIRSSAG